MRRLILLRLTSAREVLFAEVKWKKLNQREAQAILKNLEQKAELTGLDDWRKSYGIIARGIEGKEVLREKGFLMWDLDDLKSARQSP